MVSDKRLAIPAAVLLIASLITLAAAYLYGRTTYGPNTITILLTLNALSFLLRATAAGLALWMIIGSERTEPVWRYVSWAVLLLAVASLALRF